MNVNDRRAISKDKTVLLIGTFQNSAITNEIYMARFDAKSRLLTSSSENWVDILSEIDEAKETGNPVFVNLTETVLMIACNNQYSALFDRLVEAISETNHIIFIYQDAFVGKFNIFDKPYYKKYRACS